MERYKCQEKKTETIKKDLSQQKQHTDQLKTHFIICQVMAAMSINFKIIRIG